MIAHTLNWVDYSILGIIVLSTVISFFRGFVREAVSLVVWVVGVLVALKFSMPLQVYLPHFISSPLLRYGLTFILLFIAIFIVGIVINLIVHTLVHKVGLSVTDRFLGVFFGAIRGVVLAAIFLMFVNVGASEDSTALAHSRFAWRFSPIVVRLETFLPEQMQQVSHWVKAPESISDDESMERD